MTAAELGHVKRICRCGHTSSCHAYTQGQVCEECDCDKYEPPRVATNWNTLRDPSPAALELSRSPRPVVAQLLSDVAAIISRRRQDCYGSLYITDAQVDELSRAIVAGLLGNYDIKEQT